MPNFNPCEAYHQAVDDQGATLTIVSANGGYIFGGYNPLSWISDFMYTETSESYLFQIANPNSKIDRESNMMNYSLAQSYEQNNKSFKGKNPAYTAFPPIGPVRCPLRLQKKDKAIKLFL